LKMLAAVNKTNDQLEKVEVRFQRRNINWNRREDIQRWSVCRRNRTHLSCNFRKIGLRAHAGAPQLLRVQHG
jgi:hypothetical protein